ncbi:LysR substrate-binding domain-containing protein [Streptomyces sp. NPDC057746]|uniref:LysR substrate-binding domain-containing protein n=1 Tax=Streptomyces sp. NPDC057746 TaxID=3346237 RepID=UPI00367FB2DA
MCSCEGRVSRTRSSGPYTSPAGQSGSARAASPADAPLLTHARRRAPELTAASERSTALNDPALGLARPAFLHSAATWLVPQVLKGYRAEAPAVRFELRQAAGHETLEVLQDQHADVAATGPRPVRPNSRGTFLRVSSSAWPSRGPVRRPVAGAWRGERRSRALCRCAARVRVAPADG